MYWEVQERKDRKEFRRLVETVLRNLSQEGKVVIVHKLVINVARGGEATITNG